MVSKSSTKAVIFTKDIIVSQESRSNDTIGCGNVTLPCNTIEYALKLSQSFDAIIIDGGQQDESYKYIINSTLQINKEITIKSINQKPNITTKPGYTSSIFNITKNFTLTSIQIIPIFSKGLFAPIFVVNCKQYKQYILINNCYISYGPLFFSETYEGHINIQMNDSTVNEIFHYFNFNDKKTVNKSPKFINKTKVSVVSVYMHRCLILTSNIVITNNIWNFKETKFQDSQLTGYYSIVKIYDSIFLKSAILFQESVLAFHNVSFKGNYIPLKSIVWWSAQITIIVHSFVDIKHCHFEDAIYGSIDAFNSSINIINSTFKNNQQIHSFIQRSVVQFEICNLNMSWCYFENNNTPMTRGGTINYNTLDNHKIDNHIIMIKDTIIIGAIHINNTEHSVIYIHTTSVQPFEGNVTFTCQENHYFKYFYSLDISPFRFLFICVQCANTKYSLRKTTLSANDAAKNIFHQDQSSICLQCPYEGICENGIRSKGNYWGYINKANAIEFIHCPTSYCCSTPSTCLSYNTCINNRKGTLCGQCIGGYSVSLFGHNQCINNQTCRKFYFWFIYVIFAIVFLLFFLYLKEIVYYIKTLFKRVIKKKSSTENNKFDEEGEREGEREGEGEEDREGERGSPFQMISYQSMECQDYPDESAMVEGIIKIVFFFYQIASIIRIDTSTKTYYHAPVIIDYLTSFFNVRIDISSSNIKICPFYNNDSVVAVEVIKSGFFIICLLLLLMATLSYLLSQKLRKITNNQQNITRYTIINSDTPAYSKQPFMVRIKCTYIQLLLLSYSSIAILSFKLVHCVEIQDQNYLYIQAFTSCYKAWQYVIFAGIAFWVAPFCLALYFGSRLLVSCKISPNKFILIVTFPPVIFWYLIKSRLNENGGNLSQYEAMLAKHLLAIVNLPFRYMKETHIRVEWEPILIFRRLLLVIVSTFIISPFAKLYLTGLLLICHLLHHVIIHPYKDKRLNIAETISLATLCFLNLLNTFWAFTDEVDIRNSSLFMTIGAIFIYLELIILLLPFVILFVFILIFIILFIKYVYKELLCKQD